MRDQYELELPSPPQKEVNIDLPMPEIREQVTNEGRETVVTDHVLPKSVKSDDLLPK